MKSIFEDNLDKFFYGDTCVEDNPLPQEEDDKETVKNFSRQDHIKNFCVVAFSAVAISLSINTFSNAAASPTGAVKASVASTPSKIDDREKQNIVKKVNRLRVYYSFTQENVADLLNVSVSTISKLERGEHAPDPRTLNKLYDLISLSDYLKDRLNDKKFAMRQIFHVPSKLFDNMTAIAFSKSIGEEGLNELTSLLKRLYG